MKKFLTFSRINQILVEINKSWLYHWNDSKILEIEIQEIIDLWFIRLWNNDLILWDETICEISKEWKKFLNTYSGYQKIEYFFKDYPSLSSLLIWFIWWIWALMIKSAISWWCNL